MCTTHTFVQAYSSMHTVCTEIAHSHTHCRIVQTHTRTHVEGYIHAGTCTNLIFNVSSGWIRTISVGKHVRVGSLKVCTRNIILIYCLNADLYRYSGNPGHVNTHSNTYAQPRNIPPQISTTVVSTTRSPTHASLTWSLARYTHTYSCGPSSSMPAKSSATPNGRLWYICIKCSSHEIANYSYCII